MKIVLYYFSYIFVSVLFFPTITFSQTASPGDINSSLNSFVEPTGIEQQSLTEAAGGGIEVAYSVMGLIFFVMAIYAGILWMTAQGKEDTITKARNILIGAVLGLTVVVGAYGITSFITSRAVNELSSGGNGGRIQSGAGNEEDGTLEPEDLGCCVYRTSRRTRVYAYYMSPDAADCQTTAEASGVDNTVSVDEDGDGEDDFGEGWRWYDNNSPEWCAQAMQCYMRPRNQGVEERGDERRSARVNSCVSNISID